MHRLVEQGEKDEGESSVQRDRNGVGGGEAKAVMELRYLTPSTPLPPHSRVNTLLTPASCNISFCLDHILYVLAALINVSV